MHCCSNKLHFTAQTTLPTTMSEVPSSLCLNTILNNIETKTNMKATKLHFLTCKLSSEYYSGYTIDLFCTSSSQVIRATVEVVIPTRCGAIPGVVVTDVSEPSLGTTDDDVHAVHGMDISCQTKSSPV